MGGARARAGALAVGQSRTIATRRWREGRGRFVGRGGPVVSAVQGRKARLRQGIVLYPGRSGLVALTLRLLVARQEPEPEPELTATQKAELKQMFNLYDKDKSGLITKAELTQVSRRLLSSG
eukprot:3969211-Prymnesium_polylepis.1